jgi:molecular chaperone GrpE
MKDENKKIKNDEEKSEEKVNNEEGSSEDLNNKVDEKSLRISELEKETAELKDKFLRKVAEFENYKRRTENDQLNLIKYSAATFIIRLLPVIDDFERSLDHIEDAKDINAIKEGLKLIYGKLKKALDEEGVKKIEAAGKPFDVNYHEAIMQRPDESVSPHTVLDEVEKGYMYKDKVIRHSKVIVSEETSEEPAEKNKDEKNK